VVGPPPSAPYGHPGRPPRPPLRVWRLLGGCVIAPGLHATLGALVILVAALMEGGPDAAENQLAVILIGIPAALLVATLTSVVLGLVLVARKDRSLGYGILLGWLLVLLLAMSGCVVLALAPA
jgi:hypothetical protein